jgi:hypothetical protein
VHVCVDGFVLSVQRPEVVDEGDGLRFCFRRRGGELEVREGGVDGRGRRPAVVREGDAAGAVGELGWVRGRAYEDRRGAGGARGRDA